MPEKNKEIIGQGEVTVDELASLERLLHENLPDSPIDLDFYTEIASKNENVRIALKSMLAHCLRYTEDVAEMEKIALSIHDTNDETRVESDVKRTRSHDATIDSINIFARTLRKEGYSSDWLSWSPNKENRPIYGSFATLLTLNRFKEMIQKYREEAMRIFVSRVISGEINISSLKSDQLGAAELMTIEYVEIMAQVFRSKSDTTRIKSVDPGVHVESDNEKLKQIEQRLEKDTKEILGAFYEIYKRRYSQ